VGGQEAFGNRQLREEYAMICQYAMVSLQRAVNSSGAFLYKLKSNNKGQKPFMRRFPNSWEVPVKHP